MINIDLQKLPKQINYQDKILLTGSCFTEHIGNGMAELKFSVLQNPSGILFDPHSVAQSLKSYIQNKKYTDKDFFQLNGVWHSWAHHSRFSRVDLSEGLQSVNESTQKAHVFLEKADWVIVTLGSSFSYQLTELANSITGFGVANCHRAPAQWFDKHLMTIDEIVSELGETFQQLFHFNPALNIILTVSPVRHIRDGVVSNNRSKARLIEAVYRLINQHSNLYYFPAYELVIDVLRDYRFYDADLAHPNYMATTFVLEKFADTCIDEESRKIMEEVRAIVVAKKHKAFQPETSAHRQFLKIHLEKAIALKSRHSFLDLEEEINHFNHENF
ncbi:MAG TPA: GSCFA domain-containing protein [Chitinophagaceae bacterium]|jgi:hypothetical protein